MQWQFRGAKKLVPFNSTQLCERPGIVVEFAGDEIALSERGGLESQAVGERDDDPWLNPIGKEKKAGQSRTVRRSGIIRHV
jgi:hypothetical protein